MRTPSPQLIPSPSSSSSKGKARVSRTPSPQPREQKEREIHIDGRPITSLLHTIDPESAPALPAEEDELTMLDVGEYTGGGESGEKLYALFGGEDGKYGDGVWSFVLLELYLWVGEGEGE